MTTRALFTGWCAGALMLACGTAQAQRSDDESALERSQSDSFAQPSERSGDYIDDDGLRSRQNAGRERSEEREQFGRQEQRQDQRSRQQDGQQAGLGITMSNADEQGVLVRFVHPDSPAEQAGVEQGDVIQAVNGQRISSPQQMASWIRQQEPGEEVELRVVRDGRQGTLTANLERRSEALSRLSGQDMRGDEERFSQQRSSQSQEMAHRQAAQRRYGSQYQQDQQQAGGDQREMFARLQSLERQVQQISRQIDDLQRSLQASQGSRESRDSYNPRGGQRRQDSQSQRRQDDRRSQSDTDDPYDF